MISIYKNKTYIINFFDNIYIIIIYIIRNNILDEELSVKSLNTHRMKIKGKASQILSSLYIKMDIA